MSVNLQRHMTHFIQKDADNIIAAVHNPLEINNDLESCLEDEGGWGEGEERAWET